MGHVICNETLLSYCKQDNYSVIKCSGDFGTHLLHYFEHGEPIKATRYVF